MKKMSLWMIVLSAIFLIKPLISYGAKLNIVLDGYFEDWVDKPQAELKYTWNNPGQVHVLKWDFDENDLYLYIKMGVRGGQKLNYYTIFYQVDNGVSKMLAISPDTPAKGRISIIDVNRGYTILTTDGYVLRGNNNNGKTSDQGEFRIPLAVFEQDTNNQMFTLSLQFPNLGSQTVIFEAGDTIPYLGIGISVVVAVLGGMIYQRKRRKQL